MAEVNAQIPLSFRPTPNIGPDIGGAIADAQGLIQIRQAREQEQRVNALRNILGQPGAIGPMGVPTPEATAKVYGIAPELGMKLTHDTNALQVQQGNIQRQQVQRYQTIQEMVDPIRTAAIRLYNDTPGPVEAKNRAAQTYMSAELDKLRQGGGLTPQEAQQLPTAFDIGTATARSAEWQKQQDQLRREKRLETHDREMNERAGTAVLKDADDRPYVVHPNAGAGKPKAEYLDGTPVPDDKITGSTKIGTGAKPVAGQDRAALVRVETERLTKEIGHPPQSAAERALLDERVIAAQTALAAEKAGKVAGAKAGATGKPQEITVTSEDGTQTRQQGLWDPTKKTWSNLDNTPITGKVTLAAAARADQKTGRPEEVTIDGRRDEAIWDGKQWVDLKGAPITGKVQRVAKSAAEGSAPAARAAIMEQILAEHPTWTLGQRAEEATKREAAARSSGSERGRAKPEDVLIDGKRDQAIWNGNEWVDLKGEPITGKVQRATKASGAPERPNVAAERDAMTVADAKIQRAEQERGSPLSEEEKAVIRQASRTDPKVQEALRKSESTAISDEAAKLTAEETLRGDWHGTVGMGRNAASMRKIADQRAILAKELGMSGADLAANTAEFMGIVAAERVLGTRGAGIDLGIAEAQKFAPMVLELSEKVDRTRFPSVNAMQLAIQKGTGGENVVRLTDALNAYKMAYTQILTRGGMPTDDSRRRSDEVIDKAWSNGQIRAAIDQLNKEMMAARSAVPEVRDNLYFALTGKTRRSPVQQVPGETASPSGGGPKATPTDNDIMWLKRSPDTAAQFEKHFGLPPGGAQQYLGGGSMPAPTSLAPPRPAAPSKEPGQDVPVISTKDAYDGLEKGQRYSKPGDPPGSYRVKK